jgi:hypothetical protein
VEGKARTRVSTGPLHTPGSSFRDPAGVRTYPQAPDLYVYRGPVSFCGGLDLLGCGVFPSHVAPFGLPIRWGQARSSAWLGDVAWLRCLHTVGEGTPDLGYRHQLYAKFTKCDFWLDEVHFLGHIISKGGIVVDPAKVTTIMDWNIPSTVSEI